MSRQIRCILFIQDFHRVGFLQTGFNIDFIAIDFIGVFYFILGGLGFVRGRMCWHIRINMYSNGGAFLKEVENRDDTDF